MKLQIIAILVTAAFCSPAFAKDAVDPMPLRMNVSEVFDFKVSLMELREDTQHRRIEGDELKVVADALASARFLKKTGHEDVALTSYISRYQFVHGFLGGTPRTGESESGMLTIDCRTLYWEGAIFELDQANAAKLKKLFPQPTNTLTKSELPAIPAAGKEAEQTGTGQPATRPVVEPEGSFKPQPEAEGRSR